MAHEERTVDEWIREIEDQLERLKAASTQVEPVDAVRVEAFGDRVRVHFGPRRSPYVCDPNEAIERLRRLDDGTGPTAVRAAFGQDQPGPRP